MTSARQTQTQTQTQTRNAAASSDTFGPSVFDLPPERSAKAAPSLIEPDRQHFRAITECLDRRVTDLTRRLAATRRLPGGSGREAMDRDDEIKRVGGQLRLLRTAGAEVCLGKIVREDGETLYIGRIGLADHGGAGAADSHLLIDWRAPAAEPFFAATHAHPYGLKSRRRYRWSAGRIRDYWDEVFSDETLDEENDGPALDDHSRFIASLGASRSPRMRDVLATIQADQDAIIRADSRGALVVDGGPGTGKTVVALHRAAYLLYADPRLDGRRGSVLVVGPHRPYLDYVADVLPGLGEDGVRSCTVSDLVPEGSGPLAEESLEAARLKSDARMMGAIEPAVALYEEPPRTTTVVEAEWGNVLITPTEWADAFESITPGAPHNEAREEVWDVLLDLLAEKDVEYGNPEALRQALGRNRNLRRAFDREWPLLDAPTLVGDLWNVPAYLRRCAPWLGADEMAALRRIEGEPWTRADLPLLDAARHRIGDSGHAELVREHQAALDDQRSLMDDVVDHILEDDDDPDSSLAMLNGADLWQVLLDDSLAPGTDIDALAGPFAHVIVDEAQELTDADWQMLVRRCPSRSFTIVGDRAQARHGFPEPWDERLERIGLRSVRRMSLTVNYRTPSEIMEEAAPVIRAAMPDANVPRSIRSTGEPVRHGEPGDLDAVLAEWLSTNAEGVACVVSRDGAAGEGPALPGRVRLLTPATVKGLEFDLVVLVRPEEFGDDDTERAVDRYVAMTRATSSLAVLA